MNRISELRKERGISMKQAAEQLGMPYTTYVNYEKGARQPNSETLIDLANFYETSIDYMLGKSDVRAKDGWTAPAEREFGHTIPKGFIEMPEMVQVPLIGVLRAAPRSRRSRTSRATSAFPAAWHAGLCAGMPRRQHGSDHLRR